MKQVRRGVFETNSSSTHSLTICTEDEFNKWANGELMFDTYNDELVEVNTKISDEQKVYAKEYYESYKSAFWKSWEQLSEEEIETWYVKYMNDFNKADMYRYQTRSQYLHNSDLETFTQTYTSPKGDKFVAFGKYGYD